MRSAELVVHDRRVIPMARGCRTHWLLRMGRDAVTFSREGAGRREGGVHRHRDETYRA
jgi:hypothetical protein